MLENAAYDFGSLLHVPPHGPCGAFGAGQPWASLARFRDPLAKRGLASGFLRKVWFWGPVHAAPVCCLFGLFVWYMCGAGSVGWCFVFRRLHENVRFRKALKQRGSFRSLPALSMPAAAVVLCDVPRCPGYPASILRPTCSCGDNVHGNCQRGHVCCATIVTR